MICQEGHIESQCEPFCSTKKHDTEESMDEVLGQYKLEEKYKSVIEMSWDKVNCSSGKQVATKLSFFLKAFLKTQR